MTLDDPTNRDHLKARIGSAFSPMHFDPQEFEEEAYPDEVHDCIEYLSRGTSPSEDAAFFGTRSHCITFCSPRLLRHLLPRLLPLVVSEDADRDAFLRNLFHRLNPEDYAEKYFREQSSEELATLLSDEQKRVVADVLLFCIWDPQVDRADVWDAVIGLRMNWARYWY